MDKAEETRNIYKRIDPLLHQGKFEEVGKILRGVDFVGTNATLLVAYITITFAAQSKLPEDYKWFYEQTYDILEICGDKPDETLAGLEPKTIKEKQ